MSPYISVIIPVYNRKTALAKTLSHIESQTYRNFEIVIVDDGSTDDTPDFLTTCLNAGIVVCRQENAGPSAARNTGLATASGDVIFYCDSDDVLYTDCLLTIANLYDEDKDATFSICNHKRTLTLINADGQTLAARDESRADIPATLQDYYNWQVKTTSTGLSHRAMFRDKVKWKSGFLIEDLEFLMQLAVLDAPGFRYIPSKLLSYDQVYGGDGMCSGATYADYAHAFGTIYALHKNDPLMTKPSVYLDRAERYAALHKQAQTGEIPPPALKYFEEFWTGGRV